jgi:hypothetical protein
MIPTAFSLCCRFWNCISDLLALRTGHGEQTEKNVLLFMPRCIRIGIVSNPDALHSLQVGLGFLVGSFLSRSAQAVTAGFGELP